MVECELLSFIDISSLFGVLRTSRYPTELPRYYFIILIRTKTPDKGILQGTLVLGEWYTFDCLCNELCVLIKDPSNTKRKVVNSSYLTLVIGEAGLTADINTRDWTGGARMSGRRRQLSSS